MKELLIDVVAVVIMKWPKLDREKRAQVIAGINAIIAVFARSNVIPIDRARRRTP